MPQYLLLLYDDPAAAEAWAALTPEEIRAGIAEYAAWADSLAERGHLRGGEKLRDGSGRVLRGERGQPEVTDGPYAEAKEVIGGYFLIEAADYDEAAALCADSPHLGHGTIELREIEPTGPDA
jgi:hypothetical protein